MDGRLAGRCPRRRPRRAPRPPPRERGAQRQAANRRRFTDGPTSYPIPANRARMHAAGVIEIGQRSATRQTERSRGAPVALSRRLRPNLKAPGCSASRADPETSTSPPFGGLAHSGRDVDVDAEVVAADPSWASEVDAGAKLRRVAVHLYPADVELCLERGVNRLLGDPKHSHGAVAKPLHQAPPMRRDRRVLCGRHPAQQLQRRLVAGVERPGGEADDVGEQDRDVKPCRGRVPGLRPAPATLEGRPAPARERRSAALARPRTPGGRSSAGPGCRWSRAQSPYRSSPGSSCRMNLAVATSWGRESVRRARSRSLPGLRGGSGGSLLESAIVAHGANRRPFRAGCALDRAAW